MFLRGIPFFVLPPPERSSLTLCGPVMDFPQLRPRRQGRIFSPTSASKASPGKGADVRNERPHCRPLGSRTRDPPDVGARRSLAARGRLGSHLAGGSTGDALAEAPLSMSRALRPHAEAAGRCACVLRAHTICALSQCAGLWRAGCERRRREGDRAERALESAGRQWVCETPNRGAGAASAVDKRWGRNRKTRAKTGRRRGSGRGSSGSRAGPWMGEPRRGASRGRGSGWGPRRGAEGLGGRLGVRAVWGRARALLSQAYGPGECEPGPESPGGAGRERLPRLPWPWERLPERLRNFGGARGCGEVAQRLPPPVCQVGNTSGVI